MKLRETHYRQMLAYAWECEEEGWYYGNKEQFNKRHREIVAWLMEKTARKTGGDDERSE